MLWKAAVTWSGRMEVGAGRERDVRSVDMRAGGKGGGRWDCGEAMMCSLWIGLLWFDLKRERCWRSCVGVYYRKWACFEKWTEDGAMLGGEATNGKCRYVTQLCLPVGIHHSSHAKCIIMSNTSLLLFISAMPQLMQPPSYQYILT